MSKHFKVVHERTRDEGNLELKPETQNKTAGFVRIRDVEGAEGGTSWNERSGA